MLRETKAVELRVGGLQIDPQDASQSLTVMNLPLGVDVSERERERERESKRERSSTLAGNIRDTLPASSPLHMRLQLLERLVTGNMRWVRLGWFALG